MDELIKQSSEILESVQNRTAEMRALIDNESGIPDVIDNIEWLESEILSAESNVLDPILHESSVLDVARVLFDTNSSHTDAENRIELESALTVLFEKSHGALKYTYRMGYDIKTGKQVAVQFKLEPDKINAVGDIGITEFIRDNPKEIHANALAKVKKTIKRYGHIDHLTEPLLVNAIFTRDNKRLDNVTLVPMISTSVSLYIGKNMGKFAPEGIDNCKDPLGLLNRIIESEEFKQWMRDSGKNMRNETYHVSKNEQDSERQGGGKYKSTKLMWDIGKFQSYQHLPSVRGFLKTNKDFLDPVKQQQMADNYDVTNRPKKGSNK
jgi:hypothetical protein